MQVLSLRHLNALFLLGYLLVAFSPSLRAQSAASSETLRATVVGEKGGSINGISNGTVELKAGNEYSVSLEPATGDTAKVTIFATCGVRIMVQQYFTVEGTGGTGGETPWADSGSSAIFTKSKVELSGGPGGPSSEGPITTEEVTYKIRLQPISDEDLEEPASEEQSTSGGGGGPVLNSDSCCSAALNAAPSIQKQVDVNKLRDVSTMALYRIPVGGKIEPGSKVARSFGYFQFLANLNSGTFPASDSLTFVPGEAYLEELSANTAATDLHFYKFGPESGKIVVRQYAIADKSAALAGTATPILRHEISRGTSTEDGLHFKFSRFLGAETSPYHYDIYSAYTSFTSSPSTAGRTVDWKLNNGSRIEHELKTVTDRTPTAQNGYLRYTITREVRTSDIRNGLEYPDTYQRTEHDILPFLSSWPYYHLRLNSSVTGIGPSREKHVHEYQFNPSSPDSSVQTKIYRAADTMDEYLADYSADFTYYDVTAFTIRPWLDTQPDSSSGLRIREDVGSSSNDVTLFSPAPSTASPDDERFMPSSSPDKVVLYQKSQQTGSAQGIYQRTIYRTKAIFGRFEGSSDATENANWRQYAIDEHLVPAGFDGTKYVLNGQARELVRVPRGIARRIERSGRVQEYSLETGYTPPSALEVIYPLAGGPYKISHVISDGRVNVGSSDFSPGLPYQQPFQSTRIQTVRGPHGPVTEDRQVWNGTMWATMSARRHVYNASNKLWKIIEGQNLESTGDVVELHEYPNDYAETITDAQGVVTVRVKDAAGKLLTETRKGAPATQNWQGQPDMVTTLTETPMADPAEPTQMARMRHTRTTRAGEFTRVENDDEGIDGTRISSTDASGVTVTYGSGSEGGHATDLMSMAGGAKTSKSSRHLDGQPYSEGGTGQVKKVYAYALRTTAPKGIEETETTLNGETPVAVVKRLKTGDGEILSETANGITTTFAHDASGRVIAKTTPGQGSDRVYRYVYDYRDLVVREGYDINGDGQLTAGSTDTLIERERYYELTGGHWWLINKQIRYLEDGNATSKLTTTYREKQGTGAGSVSEVTYPNGTVETRTTTVSGKEVTTTTTSTAYSGRTQTEITYNGRLVSSQDFAQSKPVLYRYDALGRMTKTHDTGSDALSLAAYDGTSERISSTQNAAGEIIRYAYYGPEDPNAGRLHWAQNPAGERTYYAYSLLGQITHQWGKGGQPLRYGYDGAGRMLHLDTFTTQNPSLWDGAALPAAFATATYSRRSFNVTDGRLMSRTFGSHTADGGLSYTYHADGLLHERTHPNEVYRVTTYGHDGAGRLTSIDNTGPYAWEVDWTYDRSGRVKTRTDYGGVHSFAYDALGGVEETVAGGLLDGLTLKKTLNGAGKVTGIEWSFAGESHKASYAYDDQKRLEGAGVGPVSGPPLVTAAYGYQPEAGWVKTVTRPITGGEPLVGTRRLDAAGRLDTLQWQRGSTVYGGYDYDLDAAGRRALERRLDGTRIEYYYNTRGELTTALQRKDASVDPDQIHTYNYDESGDRTNALTPEWQVMNYVQTNVGAGVSAYRQTQRHVQVPYSPGYAIGRTKRWLRGRADAQAVVTVDGIPAERDGERWRFQVSLDEDEPGRRVEVKASRPDLSPVPPEMTRTHVVNKEDATSRRSQRGNRSMGTGIVEFNADGQFTLYTQPYPGIQGETDPKPVKRAEYRYDGLGRRISKKMSRTENNLQPNLTVWAFDMETVYIWQDWTLVAELVRTVENGPWSLRRSYLWGLDVDGTFGGAGGVGGLLWVAEYVPGISGSNRQLAPWYDGNGNVMGWVENEGAQTQPLYRLEYDPYGELVIDEAVRPARTKKQRDLGVGAEWLGRPPQTFSTKYEDEESGLLYYGYRYYLPREGNWISRDPIEERGGINLYGFCFNDAINYLDTDGRAPMNAGVGGPQVLPPGGYPRTPDQPENRGWDSSNLEQLLSKVDNEGKIGKKCDECLLKKVRAMKKDILRFAIEWNKKSPKWCRGNECGEQATNLATEINLKFAPPGVHPNDIFWLAEVSGGNKLPSYAFVVERLTNHNFVSVGPFVLATHCGFDKFYIDAFKGQSWQHRNDNNGIDTGPLSEYESKYPYPVK